MTKLVLGVTPAIVSDVLPFFNASVLATLAPEGAVQLTRITLELPASTAFMVDLAKLPETTQGNPGSAQVVCAMAGWLGRAIQLTEATVRIEANPRSAIRVSQFLDDPSMFGEFEILGDRAAEKIVMD
jgi:hypothetical protein